jgi:hypothetical protein
MQFVNQSHECCVNEGFNKNFERHALDVVLYIAQTSYFSTNHQHFVLKMANHLPSAYIYPVGTVKSNAECFVVM